MHAFLFEACIQTGLDALPNCVAVRLDDHTATDCRLLRKVCFYHQFVVPLRVVLASGRKFLISHNIDDSFLR